ncbi:FAD_binding_3 domain-containing protein, partial [Haematococcus lacustris]
MAKDWSPLRGQDWAAADGRGAWPWRAWRARQPCALPMRDAAHPMTPNLGQGGCAALEDAVVLARELSGVAVSSNGSDETRAQPSAAELEQALRRYEAARVGRCLSLTARSGIMGVLLQLPMEPVISVRDLFVSHLFSPDHFLDHTQFDPEALPQPSTQPVA